MNIPATRPMQFSLGSLFEFTTICCAIASLASFVGIVAGVFLVAFALSLATRSGDAAIFMVMTASLTAGLNAVDAGSGGYLEQLVVLLAAALISSWFWVRHLASASKLWGQKRAECEVNGKWEGDFLLAAWEGEVVVGKEFGAREYTLGLKGLKR